MKAIVSVLVSGSIAGLSSLLTALQGENAGFATITDGQWVTAGIAFLIGTGVGHRVYHTSPSPSPVPPQGSLPPPADDDDAPRATTRRRTTRRPAPKPKPTARARATTRSRATTKPEPAPEKEPEQQPAAAEPMAGNPG